jgi:quinolinate synthase
VANPLTIVDDILRLKHEKKAVILAHNYQRPEIQDVADYVGDSIELSRQAMKKDDAKIIVFCAVDFMAENAVILNPGKKVLLPSAGARCPMAQMLTVEEIRRWKSKYPKLPIVLYVNTLAEVKAESDICCTSANAIEVIKAVDSDALLFGPDRNLALYAAKHTNKKIIPIPERGFCPTHVLFQRSDIDSWKEKYPDATVIVHPECTLEVQAAADYIGSTSQMCRYARQLRSERFVIGTESGIIHRLKKENPNKEFILAYDGAVCPNMKLNTLERLYLALKEEKYQVTVPKPIGEKARKALDKMLSIV